MKTACDLSTTYLGLPLRSPLVPSASPLSEHLRGLLEMERCGAGAIVRHSVHSRGSKPRPERSRRGKSRNRHELAWHCFSKPIPQLRLGVAFCPNKLQWPGSIRNDGLSRFLRLSR